jgi:hypothetical protein
MHGMRQRQAGQAASDIRDDDHDVGAGAQERERLIGVHGLDDVAPSFREPFMRRHPHEGASSTRRTTGRRGAG